MSVGESANGTESDVRAEPVSILVVDDHETFRKALCDIVDATSGFDLVGEAPSGEAALEAAAELEPRMVIIDNRMPGMSGIQATRMLTNRHAEMVVLLVSIEAFDDPDARSCGAAAFACKHELSPGFLREVWRAHSG